MDERSGFAALTPTAFLRRSALVFADRVAVADDTRDLTYAQWWDEARRTAGALAALGLEPRDRVAVLAPNSTALLTLHYAAPLAGIVLVALNVRLGDGELAAIVAHCGARVLIYDPELAPCAAAITTGTAIAALTVDDLAALAAVSPSLERSVDDEMSLLALNYTSGTTGTPKGVMYSHRGAYLQALAMAYHARLDGDSVYLWTLPMFHCNGWCFTWAVTAAGGTHRPLRKPEPAAIWAHLRTSRISHLCAAPTVLAMLANHPDAARGPAQRAVRVFTGGAPPSPALLERMAEVHLDVHHLYGLTETYGPAVISEWRSAWDELPLEARAERKARQGVGNVVSLEVRVLGADGSDVPADGTTHGEIALRGNNVMLGYYRNPEATQAAVPDGWFRTGDVGVMHPDGYVELRDRSKDIIISGGENIASVEVERVLERHPAVLEAAVVAAPDPLWGEIPVAFVALRENGPVDEGELIAFARGALAHFKAPKRVVFGDLPKTGTGKIQKFALRERARAETRTHS